MPREGPSGDHRVRQIRTAARSRHTAPSFILLAGLELMQLRKLGDLAFRLFIELLAMADHVTGQVSTSYAVLLALLDFDQVACAHAADKPTPKRIRTALDHLVELRLVRLDRIKNEKAKGLFLKVKSRAGISASEPRKGSMKGRPENGAKPATARSAGARPRDEGQTDGQGVQEKRLTPLPPSFSTDAKPSRTVQAMKAKLRPRADRPSK
jgi:hypothetical protein